MLFTQKEKTYMNDPQICHIYYYVYISGPWFVSGCPAVAKFTFYVQQMRYHNPKDRLLQNS